MKHPPPLVKLGDLEVGDRFHWQPTPKRIFVIEGKSDGYLRLSLNGQEIKRVPLDEETREKLVVRVRPD